MYELEFTFEYQTVDAKDVLYTLDKYCPSIGLKPEDYSTAEQVLAIDHGSRLPLSGKLIREVHGGSIANHEHDYLIVKVEDIGFSKLIELVELFISELPVTQAFIHDYEYYYWQNVEELLLYESAERAHSHLPKVSNNLPFPVEQTVIDISNNPGRFVLRDGYRETISSPMWVLTSLVKDRQALDQIDVVTETKGEGILKIQAPYLPFYLGTGEQAEIQKQLRRAVYGV